MSRCIVVKEETGYRQYPLPAVYEGIAGQAEMSKRLAFIGEHAVGEYRLTGPAYDVYADWYIKFKKILQQEDPDEILHQDNRRDINILKIGLIIAAQKYESSNKIEQDDVLSAIKIVNYTLKAAAKDVTRAAMNPDNLMSQKLLGVIQRYGTSGVAKTKLLQNHSKLFTSKVLNEHLDNLFHAEAIEIFDLNSGVRKLNFDGIREIYRFKREMN